MKFRVIERDTKPVNKKENVYVTGYGQDKSWFDVIANELLELWDCKIHINTEVPDDENLEEHLLSLSAMNLAVVVVTKSFLLETNSARNVEFEYFKEKHIPVLPILLEEGLESTFNDVCGDLHLLNRTSHDYSAKLMEYLERLFGDDDLRESIPEVFSGKIFLSYRKKDRKYALQLMNLIHQFNSCKNIEIWYDDFLTLGEDYDEEIDDHLTESDIFVLVVTPNLLEEGNYVMDMEYPRANILNKKIIPVEMVPTDTDDLLKKYPDLPECLEICQAALEEIFMEAKRELNIEDYVASAENDFLLGWAFLKGINVEINRERGIELLEKSANAGFLKASNYLGRIFQVGEGVEQDYIKASEWYEKCVELCQHRYYEEQSVEWGMTLAAIMINLSDCYINLNRMQAAKKILEQLEPVSRWIWNQGVMGTGTNLGNVWMRLGMVSVANGDYQDAIQFYNKSEKILEAMYKSLDTFHAARSYALLLGKQGELCIELYKSEKKVSYLYDAISYFEKAEPAEKRLIEVYKQKGEISNLGCIHMNLGWIYFMMVSNGFSDKIQFCLEMARKQYWHAVQELETLPKTKTVCVYMYAGVVNMLAYMGEQQNEIEIARKYYNEAYKAYKYVCDERGDDQDYFGLATVEVCLAVIGMEIPDKELLKEAYNILEILCQRNPDNQQFMQGRNVALRRLQAWPINLG